MGMSNFRILLAVASAIVLFLYGLEGFSQEIQRLGGATLSKWLGRLTESRWRGLLLGAVATAIVQSSSAITSLTVALVDAGTMSFGSSLGVLLGANDINGMARLTQADIDWAILHRLGHRTERASNPLQNPRQSRVLFRVHLF